MPSAPTSMRGAFLNCRLAVNGIQKASRLFVDTRVRDVASTLRASMPAIIPSDWPLPGPSPGRPRDIRILMRAATCDCAARPFHLGETVRFPDQLVKGK